MIAVICILPFQIGLHVLEYINQLAIPSSLEFGQSHIISLRFQWNLEQLLHGFTRMWGKVKKGEKPPYPQSTDSDLVFADRISSSQQ